jgi:acyl carrier protein
MRELVRALLAEHGHDPAADETPLELDSLTLVLLVEGLEDRLGRHVPPRDVVPDHFGTVARLVAYLEAHVPDL